MISLILTIVGTVASIWGAIIAIREAKKAKESASQAEVTRQAIVVEQKKISLGKLFSETKRAMGVSIKIATQANPGKKVVGLDYRTSIHALREFVDLLKENYHYLPNVKKSLIEKEYKIIEVNLILLANESDQQKRFTIGDVIHNAMGEIIKIIKPEIDVV